MSGDGSISMWLGGVRTGDAEAAQKVWERYHSRLVGLARKKLHDMPRRVSDEEDVVVDAFDSFYRGAAEGRFPKLNDRDDLWQVLVLLTARKAVNQRKHQGRAKRGGGEVRGESVFGVRLSDEERAGIDAVAGNEPTPEFAAGVAESCENLLAKLEDETLRQIAIWKLEGHTNQEIATQMDCKERTVERKLQLIRKIWDETES